MYKVHPAWMLLLLCLSGCSSFHNAIQDPAVRLATCLSTAATSLYYSEHASPRQVDCNVQLTGEYIVIMYPARTYTNAELLEKGLSVATIRKLRQHGELKNPRGLIVVVPLFVDDAGSHSAAFGEYVAIHEWLQVIMQSNIVHVTLTKQANNTISITSVK